MNEEIKNEEKERRDKAFDKIKSYAIISGIILAGTISLGIISVVIYFIFKFLMAIINAIP